MSARSSRSAQRPQKGDTDERVDDWSNRQFASLVVPELKQRGATVRALVRDESKSGAARQWGADETMIGDLHDPHSLRAAAVGVDGVFHINPAYAPDEADLGVAMVEAARAVGVRKFVFSGVIHPSISKMSNHVAKRPVEEAIYEFKVWSSPCCSPPCLCKPSAASGAP